MVSHPVRLRFAGTDTETLAIAREAARLAFPEGVEEVDPAADPAGGGEENTPELELRSGSEPVPPRPWPVVRPARPGDPEFFRRDAFLTGVQPEEWRVAPLARVMRGVVERERLERENARLRGDLLTIARRVAHDLRSPLGGILSTAELLSEELADISPEQSALTRPLFESADTLMKLVDRMSLVARSAAGGETPRRVRMEEAWWNARQRLERRMMKEQAAIVSEPAHWPEVTGVQTWIEIMWGNFLTNALQHGRGDGPARISAGWEEGEDRNPRFWVSDGGKGVPEERRAGLFFPFQRLHEAGSPRGMGLSVTRRLAELQGGHCGYEPAEAGGGRFFFTLPGAEPSTRRAEDPVKAWGFLGAVS